MHGQVQIEYITHSFDLTSVLFICEFETRQTRQVVNICIFFCGEIYINFHWTITDFLPALHSFAHSVPSLPCDERAAILYIIFVVISMETDLGMFNCHWNV